MVGNTATGTIVPNAKGGRGITDLFGKQGDQKGSKGASTATVVPKKGRSVMADLFAPNQDATANVADSSGLKAFDQYVENKKPKLVLKQEPGDDAADGKPMESLLKQDPDTVRLS